MQGGVGDHGQEVAAFQEQAQRDILGGQQSGQVLEALRGDAHPAVAVAQGRVEPADIQY